MNVAMVLAGLTPRAKQIDGMGFGGQPVWAFEDRVGLLKGLQGPALDWAYYRYCGHEAKLLPVLRYLQASIDVFCAVRRYRLKRDTRAGLVEVALRDMTAPVCGICDGAGKVYSGRYEMAFGVDAQMRPVMVECSSCHGSGRHRLSKRGMAEVCGIDHKSWGPTHDAVLHEAIRMLIDQDRQVWCAVMMNADD